MVKLKLTGKLDGDALFFEFKWAYGIANPSKKNPFLPGDNGTTAMEFSGKGFTYADPDTIAGGVLHKVTFTDETGDIVYARLTKAKFDFAAYPDQGPLDGEAFQIALFAGNDTIMGSEKNDWLHGHGGRDKLDGGGGHDVLNGGQGKDILTGGAGCDAFIFGPDMGNDVITDFDAVGGRLKQDYLIPLADDGLHWQKSGKNVLLIFDNGTTITLLDVKYSDIGLEDFTGM